MTSAKSVFVCYAHADNAPRKRWLHRLLEHLAPVVRHDEIAVWSDQNLQAGEKWDEEIARQLATARVAILLVSPAFLASEYIANSELPVLLKRSDAEGLTILPLLLYPSLFDVARFKWPDPKNGPEELTLSSLQAVGSPSATLSELARPKQDRAFVELVKRIQSILAAERVIRSTSAIAEEASAVSISHLPSAGELLIGREVELARLSEAWQRPRENIITVIARGGEGKSNLVRHWLNDMAANSWRGAERVYGWSFYSQGTNDKASSADQFIDQALRFFGEKHPEELKSPDARGERLAQLVGSKRNLLVLDGLEPLQYPPGTMHGRLKDPALQTLVSGLLAQNRGLCVITTREELPELASTKHSLSPEIKLPPLAPQAGAKLLADLGATGSDAERELVARQLGGHAFSIHLLGTYLAEVFGGDITRAGEVALLDEDSESGKHARQILGSYEKWLSGGTLAENDLSSEDTEDAKRTGAEMLAVLRLLGLFDRPATMDAIDVLRAKPAIAELTEPLVTLSDAEWKRTLARLRNLQLIDHDLGEVETLDAHPLLREYFAEQLEKIPGSAREAHRRLYEYFKSSAPDLPDTLRAMMPLFQAVIHGCKAGEWQDALDDVYARRLQRGGLFFSSRRLGASGACLSSLAAFFAEPWRRLAPSLSTTAQSYILAEVGFYLRGIGRIKDSIEPMTLALEIDLRQPDLENASQQAENLCDVHLVIGDLATALRFGEQAVDLALRFVNATSIAHRTAAIATALHAAGAIKEATSAFEAAEEKFQKGTGSPILLFMSGFFYADLLLTTAIADAQVKGTRKRIQDLRTRVEEQLKAVSGEQMSLFDLALTQALIGRTLTFDDSNRPRAQRLFDDAVTLLRQATQTVLLPFGLHWRAEFARVNGDRGAADRDLTEVEQLAERHDMLRWQIESAVERAHFHHAFGEPDKAREKLAEAKRLIAKTDKPYVPHVWTYEEAPPPFIGVFKEGQIVGYHRCDHAIAELERLLAQ